NSCCSCCLLCLHRLINPFLSSHNSFTISPFWVMLIRKETGVPSLRKNLYFIMCLCYESAVCPGGQEGQQHPVKFWKTFKVRMRSYLQK
uniref:Uncharacterized protein n=1 Tax=Anser brachyrhynchus TaxID=132585 RepID=A0A8B9CKM9_9AVES